MFKKIDSDKLILFFNFYLNENFKKSKLKILMDNISVLNFYSNINLTYKKLCILYHIFIISHTLKEEIS